MGSRQSHVTCSWIRQNSDDPAITGNSLNSGEFSYVTENTNSKVDQTFERAVAADMGLTRFWNTNLHKSALIAEWLLGVLSEKVISVN